MSTAPTDGAPLFSGCWRRPLATILLGGTVRSARGFFSSPDNLHGVELWLVPLFAFQRENCGSGHIFAVAMSAFVPIAFYFCSARKYLNLCRHRFKVDMTTNPSKPRFPDELCGGI